MSSEVSADDYASLIGRLHSMRVSFMGEPSAGSAETNATSSGTPNTGAYTLPDLARCSHAAAAACRPATWCHAAQSHQLVWNLDNAVRQTRRHAVPSALLLECSLQGLWSLQG